MHLLLIAKILSDMMLGSRVRGKGCGYGYGYGNNRTQVRVSVLLGTSGSRIKEHVYIKPWNTFRRR